MARLSDLMTMWGSFYANHAVLRTLIAFAHVAPLIIGGGAAIAADRATLVALRLETVDRGRQREALHNTHPLVIGSLVLIVASGALMFAADIETFLYSRVFWIKMGLVALLVANGWILWTADKRVGNNDLTAWRSLHVTALASVALWLLTTLAGMALLNIG